MSNNNLYTLGIDIGSTTVKIAILNEQNEVLFSDYERHFANIQETLSDLLHFKTMLHRQTSQSNLVEKMQKSSISKAVM